MQWLNDESRESFVITSANDDDDVVGFFSVYHYTVSDTTIYVWQGMRIRHDARNMNLVKQAGKYFVVNHILPKSTKAALISAGGPSWIKDDQSDWATTADRAVTLEKYMAGSVNTGRSVLDFTGFNAKFPLTNSVKEMLNAPFDGVTAIDEFDSIYEHLKALNFPRMKFLPQFNAHLLQHFWFPFLINSSFSGEMLMPPRSPAINDKSKIRVLKTLRGMSIGTLLPIGSKWFIMVDIYGECDTEYMAHLCAHYDHFKQCGEQMNGLMIQVPALDNIAQTTFYQKLSALKSDKFSFSPQFVNQYNLLTK